MILELSKEKTNERLLDRQAAAFTASVQHVEAELSAQIRYLTQVSGRVQCAHSAFCFKFQRSLEEPCPPSGARQDQAAQAVTRRILPSRVGFFPLKGKN